MTDLEADLEKIRDWEIHNDSSCRDLLNFVQSIWWCGDQLVERRDGETWNISTGGYSDNESIIGAMMDNFLFWSMAWEESRKGGHYVFKTKWNY